MLISPSGTTTIAVLAATFLILLRLAFLTYHSVNQCTRRDDFVPIIKRRFVTTLTLGVNLDNKARVTSLLTREFGSEDHFNNVSIEINHNGRSHPCAISDLVSFHLFHDILNVTLHYNFDVVSMSKYDVDSLLTTLFSMRMMQKDACGSERYSDTSVDSPAFLRFCDAGIEHTPILPDHEKLVPIYWKDDESYLPCHFHTREGIRISSLRQLKDLLEAKEEDLAVTENTCDTSPPESCYRHNTLTLYAVPAGRIFMFAPQSIGEVFDLNHVRSPSTSPVRIITLSLQPRIFEIVNFFDEVEASKIVKRAIAETSESHKLKRSSTGASGYNINSFRTSENGFDTEGPEAMALKRRSFQLLGFDEYMENFADGLQVLKYSASAAYNWHLDWIEDSVAETHDYDSAGTGSNRFATILLYLNDVGEHSGGETAFFDAPSTDDLFGDRASVSKMLQTLRESGDVSSLPHGSWEEKLVAECRSRLTVRPKAGQAILFYSQHPDGSPDQKSLHSACPVLNGEKWAANLWVWNAPRSGYPDAPMKKHSAEISPTIDSDQTGVDTAEAVQITFSNEGHDPLYATASLFYEDMYWGSISHGDPPIHVNTYVGHVWNVKSANGKLLKQWVVQESSTSFTV